MGIDPRPSPNAVPSPLGAPGAVSPNSPVILSTDACLYLVGARHRAGYWIYYKNKTSAPALMELINI